MTESDNLGMFVEVEAPVGKPPVFYRESDVINRFVADLKSKGMIYPEKKVRRSRWRSVFGKD